MESKRDVAVSDWRLIAVLIGVIGLGRAALGLQQYPFGDDMVYGPLARLAADPTLYPGDEQLRMFDNHAWVYSLIWRAADATIGVAEAHLALTISLTLLVGFTMLWIARAVGAVGWLVPLGFLLATVGDLRGIGRGAYGGAVGDHFHLQSLAIAFSLLAVLGVLRARWIWAGAALGAAALAQPVLAFHAALAVGCYCLAQGRAGMRPLVITALASMVVAAPTIFAVIRDFDVEGVPNVERIIQDGYIWRVDNHYRLPRWQYLIFSLYAVLGAVAAWRLKRGLGLVIGLALIGFLGAGFYSGALGLNNLSILPYMLDLSRSSPVLWVLAAAFAAAAAERAWKDGDQATLATLGVLSALIIMLNGDWTIFAGLAFLAALAPLTRRTSSTTVAPVIAALGVAAVTIATAGANDPLSRDTKMRGFYEWARAETAPDASFIAPPFIADIREFAQRPVWADFRAVSMSQPDQILLSRERHEAITPGYKNLPDLGGWRGARNWTLAYAQNHDGASIAAALRRTGATYFVTYRPDTPYELAQEGLTIAYSDDHALVLELRNP